MARMVPSPVIVRRKGHNANRAADPVVRTAAVEERPVAAIMLDHEETDDQARRGHCQQEATPNPHQGPDDKEGPRCDRQLEHAARVVRLAIKRELLHQHARLWSAFKHLWTAFEHVHSKHVYPRRLPGPRHAGP